MDREQAIAKIRSDVSCLEYLEKSQGGMYCCPFCGSGHGPHKTGAVKYYPETNTICCFSRCDKKKYDVIDLFQQTTGADFNTAVYSLSARLGITIERDQDHLDKVVNDWKQSHNSAGPAAQAAAVGYGFDATVNFKTGEVIDAGTEYGTAEPAAERKGSASPAAETTDTEATKPAQTAANGPQDLSEFLAKCEAQLTDPAAMSYLRGRGISLETARLFHIGFAPNIDMSDTGYYPCPRIIIPTSKYHYVGRSIDPNTADKYVKMNSKGSAGHVGITNADALYNADIQEVFVTEGAFDAMSITEAGAAAIALNSTSNANKLITKLEKDRTDATLILCLDNDDAGKKAQKQMESDLTRLNISFISADICCGYKDPNEALTADKDKFHAAITTAVRQTAAKPDNVGYYIQNLMRDDMDAFRQEIKTGYSNLDAQTGGLYAGLYAVAAISSLGKTTFTHQLADQLAAAGHDVLFFSLEQSRLELVSKSIARRTAQNDMESAVNSLSIRRGYLPENVLEAARQYQADVGDRLSIIEGNFNCDISFIGNYVRQYVRRTNTRPVVIIDYLQILQPETVGNRQQTTKETIDSTVTALKRISRELSLTIFAISSVNRANYLTPIDFESLKESGSIEYTADVVWGLQLQCLSTNDAFNKQNNIKERREIIKEAKASNPRKIELVCLKNRYGVANFSCAFDYYPGNDLFVPDMKYTAATSTRYTPKKAGRKP